MAYAPTLIALASLRNVRQHSCSLKHLLIKLNVGHQKQTLTYASLYAYRSNHSIILREIVTRASQARLPQVFNQLRRGSRRPCNL